MTGNSLFAMIGQGNDNPRQGTGVLLEFCGIKYFGCISRSAFISLDFDECTLCYFCHQHPKDDGGEGGDRGVQLSRLAHLEFYSPCSSFSIEKYKYCCLLCNILIFLPLPIFSELLPPALSPSASHQCPPPPPRFYAVEPPKYVNDERKRYREIFRKY